jgi:hypothetical protein
MLCSFRKPLSSALSPYQASSESAKLSLPSLNRRGKLPLIAILTPPERCSLWNSTNSPRVRIPFCSSHTFPQYPSDPTYWIKFLQSLIKRVVINIQDGSQVLCRRKLQDVRLPILVAGEMASHRHKFFASDTQSLRLPLMSDIFPGMARCPASKTSSTICLQPKQVKL